MNNLKFSELFTLLNTRLLNQNNKIYSSKKNGRTYWNLSDLLDDNVQSCNVESEMANCE